MKTSGQSVNENREKLIIVLGGFIGIFTNILSDWFLLNVLNNILLLSLTFILIAFIAYISIRIGDKYTFATLAYFLGPIFLNVISVCIQLYILHSSFSASIITPMIFLCIIYYGFLSSLRLKRRQSNFQIENNPYIIPQNFARERLQSNRHAEREQQRKRRREQRREDWHAWWEDFWERRREQRRAWWQDFREERREAWHAWWEDFWERRREQRRAKREEKRAERARQQERRREEKRAERARQREIQREEKRAERARQREIF